MVKRDVLASALEKAGFEVPDYSEVEGGGFFVFARITPEVLKRVEGRGGKWGDAKGRGVDWELCEHFIKVREGRTERAWEMTNLYASHSLSSTNLSLRR